MGDEIGARHVPERFEYLAAGLIDELRLHVAPVVLGRGERLFDDVGDITPTGSSLPLPRPARPPAIATSPSRAARGR